MLFLETATRRALVRANATVRLCAAREALWRAQRHHADARRTPAESAMCHRVGAAAAELAAREQWMHWVDHGTTIRPEADGEWGPTSERPDTVGGAVERPPAPGPDNANATPPSSCRPRRLRSVP
jgi:hypothetical protein